MSLSLEQVDARRFRVGASEVGALLGIDPYKTIMDLFTARCCPLPLDEEEQTHQRWGLDVEGPILRNYAARAGWKLTGGRGSMHDDRFPSLIATPDELAETPGGLCVLDAKNVQVFHASEWGAEGTDDVPLFYAAQLQVQVALAAQHGGADHGYLIASICGAPPEAWRIAYDAEVFRAISELADRFIADHVRTGIPPDGWEHDRHALDYVARRWAVSKTERLREPVIEEIELLERLRRATEERKSAEATEDAIKALLCARVGDDRGIKNVAKWIDVAPQREPVTDWQSIAQELALRLALPIEEQKALLAKWTEDKMTRAGYRYIGLARPKKTKQLTNAAPAALEE